LACRNGVYMDRSTEALVVEISRNTEIGPSASFWCYFERNRTIRWGETSSTRSCCNFFLQLLATFRGFRGGFLREFWCFLGEIGLFMTFLKEFSILDHFRGRKSSRKGRFLRGIFQDFRQDHEDFGKFFCIFVMNTFWER
jgi:hypothetical protein